MKSLTIHRSVQLGLASVFLVTAMGFGYVHLEQYLASVPFESQLGLVVAPSNVTSGSYYTTAGVPRGTWNMPGNSFDIQTGGITHTRFSTFNASFVQGAVQAISDPALGNGYMQYMAKSGKLGGTFGFAVESNLYGENRVNRYSGLNVTDNADAMEFFFLHPTASQDERLTPFIFHANGDLTIKTFDGPKTSSNLKPAFTLRTEGSLGGRVGIGTDTPKSNLDVRGNIRLKTNEVAPQTCVATTAGIIAMTSKYTLCTCTGTQWASLNDPTLVCRWK